MTAGRWDAVFWDIGGVILDLGSVREAHRAFVEELLAQRGIDRPVEAALDDWRNAVGAYFRERDGTEFRPAREAYARGVEAVVGERLLREEWRPLMESVADEHLRPVPGAPETLRRIDEDGYHLGVVSDVDADEGRAILARFGVAERFDAITTSEEVGRTKPDPAMFEAALSAAGVPGERAVMIGDRYSHDMEGAARHGITTVANGAEDGPAVDYRITTPRELLDLLDR